MPLELPFPGFMQFSNSVLVKWFVTSLKVQELDRSI